MKFQPAHLMNAADPGRLQRRWGTGAGSGRTEAGLCRACRADFSPPGRL